MLARPHAQESHDTCAGELEAPPKQVGRHGAGVQDGGDEMEEVNCKSEIRDQL